MENEVKAVNLNGLNSKKLEAAYDLVEKMGAEGYVLFVDDMVLKSSLSPKNKFKMKSGRVPVDALGIKDLKLEYTAIKAAEMLIESGKLEDAKVRVKRASVKKLKEQTQKIKPAAEKKAEAEAPALKEEDKKEEVKKD